MTQATHVSVLQNKLWENEATNNGDFVKILKPRQKHATLGHLRCARLEPAVGGAVV